MKQINLYAKLFFSFCVLEQKMNRERTYHVSNVCTMLTGTQILNLVTIYGVYNIINQSQFRLHPFSMVAIGIILMLSNELFFSRKNRHAAIYSECSKDVQKKAILKIMAPFYILISITLFFCCLYFALQINEDIAH